MLHVVRYAIKISRLAPIAALEVAMLKRIAAYVQRDANFVVSILSALESVENSASLAQSHALGSVSIADVVTCRAERHAIDFLAIYGVTVVSNVVINARQCAANLVQARSFVSNVARQS
jgi:hypothetical protein